MHGCDDLVGTSNVVERNPPRTAPGRRFPLDRESSKALAASSYNLASRYENSFLTCVHGRFWHTILSIT